MWLWGEHSSLSTIKRQVMSVCLCLCTVGRWSLFGRIYTSTKSTLSNCGRKSKTWSSRLYSGHCHCHASNCSQCGPPIAVAPTMCIGTSSVGLYVRLSVLWVLVTRVQKVFESSPLVEMSLVIQYDFRSKVTRPRNSQIQNDMLHKIRKEQPVRSGAYV